MQSKCFVSTVTLWGARLSKEHSKGEIVHLLEVPFAKLDLPRFCESSRVIWSSQFVCDEKTVLLLKTY